jgi:hypothetical protein
VPPAALHANRPVMCDSAWNNPRGQQSRSGAMRVDTACLAAGFVIAISVATYAESTQPVLKLPNEIEFKAPVSPGTQNAVLYGDPTNRACTFGLLALSPSAVPSSSNFPASQLGSEFGLIAQFYRPFSSTHSVPKSYARSATPKNPTTRG